MNCYDHQNVANSHLVIAQTNAKPGADRRGGGLRQQLFLASVLMCVLAFLAFRVEVDRLIQLGFKHYPYWDDWDTPLGFLAMGQGSPASFLQSLFSQHNESRKVTTKLLALIIDRFDVFYSDLTINISFLVRLLTVLMVCAPALIRPLASRMLWLLRLGVLAFCLVIYAVGPANLFNGLWYVQISFFMGLLFSISSLTLLSLSLHLQAAAGSVGWLRSVPVAVMAGASGVLGIYSFAGNFILFPVAVAATVLFETRGSFGSRLHRLVALRETRLAVGALAVAVAMFFVGYQSPPHHQHLRSALPNPVYVIKFLSGTYRMEGRYILFLMAVLTGCFVVVVFGWALRKLLSPEQGPLVWPVTPLLAHVGFLVGLACLSAIGRGRLDSDMAFADRYNSFSLLLGCVVAVLLLIFVEDMMARTSHESLWFIGVHQGQRSLLAAVSLAVLTAFMLMGLHANESWRPLISAYFSERQQATQCLKSYASSVAAGADPSRLKPLQKCASLLYLHGADSIIERFPVPWCEAPSARRSRTLDSLCHDLGGDLSSSRTDWPLP